MSTVYLNHFVGVHVQYVLHLTDMSLTLLFSFVEPKLTEEYKTVICTWSQVTLSFFSLAPKLISNETMIENTSVGVRESAIISLT